MSELRANPWNLIQVILTQGISEKSLLKFSCYHPERSRRVCLIMNLTINNEQKQFSGKNISELVESLNMISTNGIALAVNEKVVPKTEWEKFQLNDNDKILIIKATQGG